MGVVEKEMMQRFFYIAAFLIAVLVTISCQPHDAFCFEHPHGATVRIDVDWSEFKEEKVSGMSVSVFSATDSTRQVQYTTETTDGVNFNLLSKDYIAFVHNQSVAEFGTIAFSGMNKLSTARVFPERCSSEWYKPMENETLVSNPEWLAFDKKDLLTTQNVIKEGENSNEPSKTRSSDTSAVTLTPKNIVHVLHATIHIKGINNYRAGRASITGMADGYHLGNGEYSTQQVTHLMESWEIGKKYNNNDGTQEGTIISAINCFGLPMEHNGNAEANKLKLSLLLADNKTVIHHVFNVGNKFYKRIADGSSPHLYLDIALPDNLPDVVPAQGDSGQNGFNAEVDDWGEEENTEVIM
jgi:hypothetical protein